MTINDAAALRVIATALGQTPVSLSLRSLRSSGTAYFFDCWDVGYRGGMSWRYTARAPRGLAETLSQEMDRTIVGLTSDKCAAYIRDATQYAISKTSIQWESTRALVQSVATQAVVGSISGWTPATWLDGLNSVSEEDVARVADEVMTVATTLVHDDD